MSDDTRPISVARLAGPCLLCDTSVLDGERTQTMPVLTAADGWELRRAHVECLLRNVLGGYGHLTDHDYWCTEMQDPDAGLSYRESALLVFALPRETT